ncbi:formylglycine-generating enzyme family protein [Gimesia sp.]|uniref:formylglycine-generating enzyme family protein n=1 Tax=Gimesia sp. TaxID=2024833 RepID=UPI003A903267
MLSVCRHSLLMQGKFTFLAAILFSVSMASAEEAKTEKEMKPYTEKILNTDVTFDMVPIPGGEYMMGSPAGEKNREDDEGPQVKVKIEPFWMGKHEVTWNEYDIWSFNLDIQRRKLLRGKFDEKEKAADAVTRPTKPYTDMTFDMGHDGYPAICMTQLAAKTYCKWLSEKTGHYYRLPTEAEWEYACRAGTKTAYSFGDNAANLDDYAWHYANCNDTYQKVGQKKPNPWGLYDIHGNVSEWVLDQYIPDAYKKWSGKGTLKFPVNVPTTLYPRVARGGSWDDEPEALRSANRIASSADWKIQDPQIPQSIWYHTDAIMVGFRVVRPLKVPTAEERKKYGLDPAIPADEGR